MSPDAVTAERVYAGQKAEILTGRYPPGTHLAVQEIANEFGTSISPVRDALQRMVGERLVRLHSGGGFEIPTLARHDIIELYRWHGQIVRLALRHQTPERTMPDMLDAIRALDRSDSIGIAAMTARLFRAIGMCSSNPEHAYAIRSAGDRLHATRILETELPDRVGELENLWIATASGREYPANTAITGYHRRRMRRLERQSIT